jgi:hypothetical protein
MHAAQDGVELQSVRIKQEVQLGTPNAFADIVVHAPKSSHRKQRLERTAVITRPCGESPCGA